MTIINGRLVGSYALEWSFLTTMLWNIGSSSDFFFRRSLTMAAASLSDGREVAASSSSSLRSREHINPVYVLQGPVFSSSL